MPKKKKSRECEELRRASERSEFKKEAIEIAMEIARNTRLPDTTRLTAIHVANEVRTSWDPHDESSN